MNGAEHWKYEGKNCNTKHMIKTPRWSSKVPFDREFFTHGTVISESFYFFLCCLTFLLPRAPLTVFRVLFFLHSRFSLTFRHWKFFSLFFSTGLSCVYNSYQSADYLIYDAHDQIFHFKPEEFFSCKIASRKLKNLTHLKESPNSTIIIRHSKSIVEIIWPENFQMSPRA